MIGFLVVNFPYRWSRDFNGLVAGFLFDRIGAVMPRASLVCDNCCFFDERENIARFKPNVLNPLMASHLVGNVSKALRKICLKRFSFMTHPQVFKRVIKRCFYLLHVWIIREK